MSFLRLISSWSSLLDHGRKNVSLGGREVSDGCGIWMVGFGVRVTDVEVSGGVGLVVDEGSVVVRLRS